MKKVILLSLVAVPFIIVGCGGGGSSTTATSAKISGTVPGTLIEAFCDNNYYAKVTSTQNGTNQHPFEIEVPTNTNCKLVMTTNENDPANRIITPIGFTDGNTIVISKDVNLGNIPLKVNYQNADDKDGDHVVDTPLNVSPNGATTNNNPVQDTDNDGLVDNYEDNDDDNVVNAYEDDDNDGIENIHDDKNDNDSNENDNGNNNNAGNDNDSSGNDNNRNDAGNDSDSNGNDNDHNNNAGNDNDSSGNDNNRNDADNDNDSAGNDNDSSENDNDHN